MELTGAIAALLGGLNLFQFIVYMKTLKTQVSKEKAFKDQEQFKAVALKIDNLDQMGMAYEKMVTRVNHALDEMQKTDIENKKVIANQNLKIQEVEKLLIQYKNQCEHCVNNKIK